MLSEDHRSGERVRRFNDEHTFSRQLLANRYTTEFEEDASRRNPRRITETRQCKASRRACHDTHRVAQNSKEPFPLPIRVSLPYRKRSAFMAKSYMRQCAE